MPDSAYVVRCPRCGLRVDVWLDELRRVTVWHQGRVLGPRRRVPHPPPWLTKREVVEDWITSVVEETGCYEREPEPEPEDWTDWVARAEEV